MYSEWSKRSRILLGVLLVLSVMILTVYFREGSNGILHRAQRYTVNIVVPLQSGVARAVAPVRSTFRFITSIGSLSTKSKKLEKENRKLKAEIVTLEQAKKENKQGKAERCLNGKKPGCNEGALEKNLLKQHSNHLNAFFC